MNRDRESVNPDERISHNRTASLAASTTGRPQIANYAIRHRHHPTDARNARDRCDLDERGIHFYGHPAVGTALVRTMMNRLKFSNDEIATVAQLVDLHMRAGEYKHDWTDASIRRFIRDCGENIEPLFSICESDLAAMNVPPELRVDMPALRKRVRLINEQMNVVQLVSPLDGLEIMSILNTTPGPYLRDAKEFLLNLVIDGEIAPNDKVAGEARLRAWWLTRGL